MIESMSIASSVVPVQKLPRVGIRFRLLVALNGTMAVLASLFLVYDYHSDRAERLTSRRVALTEEARMLLLSVTRLESSSPTSIQAHVDDVYVSMQEAHATRHVVAAQLDGREFVAAGCEVALRAISAANPGSSGTVTVGTRQFLAGRSGSASRFAVVAEDMEAVNTALRGDLLRYLSSVAILAIAGAAAISIVLARVVAKPLERLALTVAEIGRGNLGLQAEGFGTRELATLAGTLNAMSTQLAAIDRERATQMRKARRIQEHLLPHQIASPAFDAAFSFCPADDVAGDYFDFLRHSDGSWIVGLADVSGHGVSAALNAAMLKVLLMDSAERRTDPSEILSDIDRKLDAVTLPEMFATMIVIRICPETGILEYANAGHESGWLRKLDGQLLELPSTGPVVGVDIGAPWKTGRLEISAGDRVLLVTDGVTEMTSEDGELFGRQRLSAAFAAVSSDSVQQRVDRINAALATHRGDARAHDDATVILLEFRAPE
jgi:phosphoserine phosphatase RsbU/P